MLSRNLYILAGTLGFFAVVCYVIALTGIAHEPGSPADASLWQMIGIVLLVLGMLVALFGIFQTMYEQAEARNLRHRDAERKRNGEL